MQSTKQILGSVIMAGLIFFRMEIESSSRPLPSGAKVTFEAVRSTVSFKEPIFVQLTVKNQLAAPISFDLGLNRKSNIRFSIMDESGRSFESQKSSDQGFGRIGRITLQAGQTYTQSLLLNEWYQPQNIGLLTVNASLVSPIVGSSQGELLDVERTSKFEVMITARNPKSLSETCERLRTIALGTNNAAEEMEASLALSFVIDPVAIPFLSEVLDKGAFSAQQNAAIGLGRIADPSSAEVLLKKLDDADPDLAPVIRSSLAALKASLTDRALIAKIDQALGRSK